MKPIGPRNIVIAGLIFELVAITSIILIVFILGSSCALRQPSTHEEWAQRCLGKNNPEEFKACLEEWQEWEKIKFSPRGETVDTSDSKPEVVKAL